MPYFSQFTFSALEVPTGIVYNTLIQKKNPAEHFCFMGNAVSCETKKSFIIWRKLL